MSLRKTSADSSPVPAGAIYLDDLVRHYLIAEGRRRFRPPDSSDLAQFALLALKRTIDSYGLKGISQTELWDRIALRKDDILLLPARQDARAGVGAQPSFVFVNVKRVPQAWIFFNLITDEVGRPSLRRTRTGRAKLYCDPAWARRARQRAVVPFRILQYESGNSCEIPRERRRLSFSMLCR